MSASRICWDTAARNFQMNLKKNDYFQGIGSMSLLNQRIGSVSAILVAQRQQNTACRPEEILRPEHLKFSLSWEM